MPSMQIILLKKSIHTLVLDWMLPGMNGIEFLKKAGLEVSHIKTL